MARGYVALIGLAAALACRRAEPPDGERTASAYSTGSDSEARDQRVEGTGTGTTLEAPQRIPGVLTTLDQLKRQPDKKTLTALRGNIGSLEDAMRNDLLRAGLADTGEFHALTDSLAEQLGGGAGGSPTIRSPSRSRSWMRVRRLITLQESMMKTARK